MCCHCGPGVPGPHGQVQGMQLCAKRAAEQGPVGASLGSDWTNWPAGDPELDKGKEKMVLLNYSVFSSHLMSFIFLFLPPSTLHRRYTLFLAVLGNHSCPCPGDHKGC